MRRAASSPFRAGLSLVIAAIVMAGSFVTVIAQAQSSSKGKELTDGPSYDAGARRANDRRQRLDSAETKRRRKASRTKYRKQDKREALALARSAFPEELRGRLPDGEEPAEGVKIKRRLGDSAAIIEDERSNERMLMRSTQPLMVEGADGSKEPLDLTLTDRGDQFAPEAAEVPVRIADAPEAEITLPEADFSVRLAAPLNADPTVQDDRVFYANTHTDTDAVVMPGTFGAELFLQMRSAESPERYVLDITVPEGATLRRARTANPIPNDPPQTVEVVRGDETLGYVYPPNAYDADGAPIPSSMDLEGDQIVLKVPHRDLEIQYPAMVDPEVIQWGRGAANYGDWPRWFWRQNQKGSPNGFGSARNDPAYHYGLYQSMPTNSGFYSGAYAQWYYKALPYTYVYRAVLGGLIHEPFYCSGRSCSRVYQGIADPSLTYWEGGVDLRNQYGDVGGNPGGPYEHGFSNINHDFCFVSRCNRSGGQDQNAAVMGIEAYNPFNPNGGYLATGANIARNKMGWADIYLGDRTPPNRPRITAGPTGGDWFDDNAADQTLSADTFDEGLGSYSLTLNGASSGGGSKFASCPYGTNNLTNACPRNFGTTWSYRLNQGTNNMSVSAQDVVGNNSTAVASFTRKVDRSNPYAVDLSGALAARSGRGVNGPTKLRAIGRDSYSAVRRLEMLVDDQPVDASMPGTQVATQGDPGAGASMDRELDFDPATLSEGKHRVKVRATDGVGRSLDSSTIEVIVDRTKPRITQADGSLRRPSAESGELSIRAEDPGPARDTAGVARIEVFVKDSSGQERRLDVKSQDQANAPLTATYRLEATDTSVREGRATFRIAAADASGNTAPDVVFDVIIDRDDPALEVDSTLKTTPTVPPGRYEITARSTDGTQSAERAGLLSLEFRVDQDRVLLEEQDCEQGSCPMSRTWTFDTTRYPGGRHTVEVIAEDQVGHRTRQTFSFETGCCTGPVATSSGLGLNAELRFGDVDGDGDEDAVTYDPPTGALSVAKADGGRFGPARPWGSFAQLASLELADIDGDTRSDVVGRAPLSTSVRAARSSGSGFQLAMDVGSMPTSYALSFADLDGDGIDDMLGRDSETQDLRVARSNGATFIEAATWGQWRSGYDLTLVDIDDDRRADAIGRNDQTGEILLALNTEEAFDLPVSRGSTTTTSDAWFVDMNGDAMADLVQRPKVGGEVTVSAADSEGFGAPVRWTDTGPGEMHLADADPNDQADPIVRQRLTDSLQVHSTSVAVPVGEPLPVSSEGSVPADDEDDLLDGQLGVTATQPQPPTATLAQMRPRPDMFMAAQGPGPDRWNATLEERQANQAQRQVLYARFKELGVSFLRINVFWGEVLFEDGTYEWSRYDMIIDEARAAGFKVYLTMTGAEYEACVEELPDRTRKRSVGCVDKTVNDPNPAGYAAFVGETVSRYSTRPAAQRVLHYSLWNEPNNKTFMDVDRNDLQDSSRRSGQRYHLLYREGYREGKGRCGSCKFFFGEVTEANSPLSFLREALTLPSGSTQRLQTDGLAYHPYQHRVNPTVAPNSRRCRTQACRFDKGTVGMGRLADLQRFIAEAADDQRLRTPGSGSASKKPRLYLTEFGYFNRRYPRIRPDRNSHFHSEERRSDWFRLALDEAVKRKARMMLLYQAFEVPPKNYNPDCTVAASQPSAAQLATIDGIWDSGLFRTDGAVTGERCYGKPGLGSMPSGDFRQDRRAYCTIWRWTYRRSYHPNVSPPMGTRPDGKPAPGCTP